MAKVKVVYIEGEEADALNTEVKDNITRLKKEIKATGAKTCFGVIRLSSGKFKGMPLDE